MSFLSQCGMGLAGANSLRSTNFLAERRESLYGQPKKESPQRGLEGSTYTDLRVGSVLNRNFLVCIEWLVNEMLSLFIPL